MARNNTGAQVKTSTLEEFITYSSKTIISYQNLSFVEKFGNVNFPVWNVMSDYLDDLDTYCMQVKLTDEEFAKYVYRPKLLAYYIYGATELFFIILMINDIASAKEFDKQTIKLIRPDQIDEIINMIYNANKKDIDTYNKK